MIRSVRVEKLAILGVVLAVGCSGKSGGGTSATSSASTSPTAATAPAATAATAPAPSGTATTSAPTAAGTTKPGVTTPPSAPSTPTAGSTSAVFAPTGAAEEVQKAIVKELDAAKTSIDVAQYNFTSDPLGQALIRAHKRGVQVRVLFDSYQAKLTLSQDSVLQAAGVPAKLVLVTGGALGTKFHHKFAVIDASEVVTGSYNWTESADQVNYENVVFVRDATIAQAFQKEFDSLWTTGKGGVGTSGDVVFSPTGSAYLIQKKLCDEIAKAKSEIVIAVYQFSSKTVAKALAAAIARGVKVTIMTDANEKSVNSATLALLGGATAKKVYLPGSGAFAPKFHDKFAVIDGQTVITGSFNWNVNQDQRGWENLVVLRDPALAKTFLGVYSQIWSSSVAH